MIMVVRAAVGGLLAASVLGLCEALWLASYGVPDGLAPLYAIGLYGALGAGFGLATGVVLAALTRVLVVTPQRAVAIGAVGAFVPMSLFLLRYVANKALYGEQGVPPAGMVAILAVVTACSMLVLLGVPALLRRLVALDGPAGAGGLGAVLLAFGAGWLALHPADDPRATWAHGRAPGAGPNVLIVMVDTLRADHLGTYGADNARTPAIDAFAAESVVFEHAFANASWTRASTASLLTSRLPSSHTAALKASRLPDDVTTVFESLHAGGYATGALVNNINVTATFGFDQGFDTFIYESPEYRFGATESVFGLTFYKVVHKVAERVLKGDKRVEQYYQPADVVLGDAQGFIEANKGGRWGLFVHLMEPHDPYFGHPIITGAGPEEYDGTGFGRAEFESPAIADAAKIQGLYRDEIAFLDTKWAPFVAWLRASGEYDDTLIVFTADHGEEFAEHGGFWHGTTLYDEQLHIPMIVKLPNQRSAGVRVPWQVSSLDVAPTITSAAGLPSDPSWKGAPMEPLVAAWVWTTTTPPPAPIPAPVPVPPPSDESPLPVAPALLEVSLWAPPGPCDPLHASDRAIVAEEDFEGNQLAAIRMRTFKYIRANAGNPRGLPERELFHVAADPGETVNHYGSGSKLCGSYPDSTAKSLDEDLGKIVLGAASSASGGATATIDAAECERLKALGYMDANTDCH